jgi:hypothetical protein
MYLDPIEHGAFTGFPVSIGANAGALFHAFNKQISGEILATVPSELIVQSWRSVKFRPGDPDSTLILKFTPETRNAEEGRIDLLHLDVPEHDFQDVTAGWHKHYWDPWRTYLKRLES